MQREYQFTSESVSEGHPDKVCDQISDAVLDEALKQDPNSRVACEVYISNGFVLVGGEITTHAYIDTEKTVRNVLREIGYTDPDFGIDARSCGILTLIKPQSHDISQGVTPTEGLHHEQGAGDQGLVFGFACDETTELMPAPIVWAHKLIKGVAAARKRGEAPSLRPDGKSQITVNYKEGRPHSIHTVVLSQQHDDVDSAEVQETLMKIAKEELPSNLLTSETIYHINPTGRFVVGGPEADVGLTGRKIIVDTYGGLGRHGGGAFSGKDPSKVDRSGAYMARYMAKHIVAAKLATRVEIQISYAIGVAEPLSVFVNSFGTATSDDLKLERALRAIFDMRPASIIAELNLKQPIYRQTAAYGHFGNPEFPWEKTPHLESLSRWMKEN